MAFLIYPTINLFLYDLRDGLGQNPQEIDGNRKHFPQKLPENIRSSIFENDTEFEAEFVKLLGEQAIEVLPLTDRNYEGYYYPVRLNDTYGLLLDCSVQDQTNSYPASCIATLKSIIDQTLNGQIATLGQTWMILGAMPTDSYPNQNPETIARECYQALIPNADWSNNLQGKGYFLGGSIFELWRHSLGISDPSAALSTQPFPSSRIEDNHHVIIAIYPNRKIAKEAANFIDDWMHLLSYHHKILWAYRQSRYLKQELEKNFIEITNYTRDIKNENLKQLRKTVIDTQKTLSRYTIELNDLSYQIRTIDINWLNYNRRLINIQQCLSQIQAKTGEESIQNILPNGVFSWLQASAASLTVTDDNQSALLAQLANWQNPCDLKFLEKFSEDIAKKYQLQVQKDYENLSPGLQLLQDLINSSRAITEIDQAERDRTFQNTVAILGVGLAAGSFVASIAGQFPGAGDTKPAEVLNSPVGSTLSHLGVPSPWLVPTTSIVISLGAAIATGALTALVIKLSWLARKLGSRSR